MTQSSPPHIWISGSKQFPKIAHQLSNLLTEMSVPVESEQSFSVGSDVSKCVQDAIQGARGIIVLLGSTWNATVAIVEGPAIAARCSGVTESTPLWIVEVDAALMPPVLDGLAHHHFPRAGNPLGALPRSKRIEVLAALRRSVAAGLGLSEPRDSQYHQLESYRASQRDSLSAVPLKGFFTAQHPASARTFRFADLFVPLRLEWFQLPPDIKAQFQQLEARLQDENLGSDERWRCWEARNTLAADYKTGGSFSLDEALKRFRQIMLLGKPGSGKSSILHHLALRAHASGSELAVLIKLSALAEKVRSDDSLWPYVLRKVESDFGMGVAAAFGERAPEGRALLLLDGVDEVRKEQRALLVRAVERMLLQHKGLRCVVSSRLAADCWLDDRIPHMQAAELNQEEIAAFVMKHKQCDNPATAETQSSRLIKTITSSRALGVLAPNPLSLRLLCLLDHGTDGLPVDQVALYERAIVTLLETWPANRVARRVNVSPEQLRQALASAAAWMHHQGQHDATSGEWLRQLAEALPRSSAKTREQLAVCCMDAATLHSGILVEASPERFEFLHLTFTEYLAADHYIRQGLLRELAAQRNDSRYVQVIRFAVEILKRVKRNADEAGRFLQMLAEEAQGQPERIQHPHLLLVARCLGSGEGFPKEVVEDLFCAILRAALLPLASTVEAADAVLKAVQLRASPRMIAACASLAGHGVASLVVAAARFVARSTVDQPDAQVVCRRWLSSSDRAVGCYAALGLVRAWKLPEGDLFRIAYHLAHAFHKDIAAVGEVEQALREHPELIAAAESLQKNRNSAEGARLLTLTRPHDWSLLRFVIGQGGEADDQSVCLAALRSEQSAEQLVEHYLENARPHTHPRPHAEAVLHALFAESAAVRRRLLLHFRRPLPEASGWEHRQDPARGKTEVAESFLRETARSGEERARSREALLLELHELLPQADADLCRRIGTLIASFDTASSLLANALDRCVQAGGYFRIWAIEEAFRLNLYHVAVAGTLARAESPGCMAAAVLGLRRQFRSGNSLPSLVSALDAQPKNPLCDGLLLLCRVREGQEPAHAAHELLRAPLGSVPLPLCWWAAAEAKRHVSRRRSSVPSELLGPIAALVCVRWQEPPDLPPGGGIGRTGPAWVPNQDRWSDSISLSEAPDAPSLRGEQKLHAARQCLTWLRELVQAGAELHLMPEWPAQWLREALAEDVSLFRAIIHDLDHSESRIQGLAAWILVHVLAEENLSSRSQGVATSTPSTTGRLHLEEFFKELASASQTLRWRMTAFLCSRGVGGDRLRETLISFLSAEHSLPIRWAALDWLRSMMEAAGELGLAVLCAVLVAEDPWLRLDAVEYGLNQRLSGLNYEEALRPLLTISTPSVLLLEAVSLWIRIPGCDRRIVEPLLIHLLGKMEPATHLRQYRVSGAIRHLAGPTPEGQPQPVHSSRFGSVWERDWQAFWAAALLTELGGRGDALRSAAASWLAAIPPDSGGRELWYSVRRRALSVLAEFGLGSAGALVDRVLVDMIDEEGYHPRESLTWIAKLQRLSEPILERLLPCMLREYYGQDKELADWVLGRAQEDDAVRRALSAVLGAALERLAPPSLENKWAFLKLLHRFSLLDDRAAELFVSAASLQFPEIDELDWVSQVVAHPDVQRRLFVALRTLEPGMRIRLIDWLLPLSLITDPDRTKCPTLTQQAHDLLREWLSDADYGLRMEAGERLFRLGYREESVLQSLRSCLQAPLDWFGSYYGDGARLTAVRILGELEQISPQERLDSLIPVVNAARNFSEVKHALDQLIRIPECHESVLDAIRHALQRIPLGSPFEIWPVVQVAFKLGLPDVDRVPILLRLLCEDVFERDEVMDALATALGESPVASEEDSNQGSDDSPGTSKRPRLQSGLHEGALGLAELARWPDVLLRHLAASMGSAEEDLRLLEEKGDSMAAASAISLLDDMVHTPDTSALAMLARHACLFRFAHLAGVTETHLKDALQW